VGPPPRSEKRLGRKSLKRSSCRELRAKRTIKQSGKIGMKRIWASDKPQVTYLSTGHVNAGKTGGIEVKVGALRLGASANCEQKIIGRCWARKAILGGRKPTQMKKGTEGEMVQTLCRRKTGSLTGNGGTCASQIGDAKSGYCRRQRRLPTSPESRTKARELAWQRKRALQNA